MTSRLPGPPKWMICVLLGLIPIWLPLLIVAGPPAYGGHKLWRKYGPISSEIEQPPLPKRKRRRRALSFSRTIRRQHTEDVDDKCGFWRLPYEIREMIWRDVLLDEDGLKPIRLFRLPDGPRLSEYFDGSGRNYRHYSKQNPKTMFMGILKANRRFYTEGIELLYTSTAFHIAGANALVSFTRQVSPTHLAQIRRLHFEVNHLFFEPVFSELRSHAWHARTWQRACKHLELFTGLQELKITIRVHSSVNVTAGWGGFGGDGWKKVVVTPLLDPLTRVQVREGASFVVEYPWPEGVFDSWPGATFTMQRLR